MRKEKIIFFLLAVIPGLFLFTAGRANAKAIREETKKVDSAEEYKILKNNYVALFAVGNVVSPRDLGGPRFELLKKHFGILTAENAMKPLYLQGEKGIFTFETSDMLVDAALEAGIKVHGHTLAWHQQSPEWMNREGISRDEAIENLVTHAKIVAGHFSGRVVSWDVLNEAIIDNPPDPGDWKSSLRQTPWLKAIGPEYIEIVFRAAREADPSAILYYNDYNLDNQKKALAVYNMVKDLNEQYPDVYGRPLIDAVGMQGHYSLRTNPDNTAASLKRFASLGLRVSITELDVQAGQEASLTDEQALFQGIMYARLFALFREHASSLDRVTIWGLDDGASWRKNTCPVLFDANLREKPAFFAALDPAAFLAENESRLTAFRKEPRQAEAFYGAPALDPADPLWENAQELPVNQYVMAWQGAAGTARVLWNEHFLYVLLNVANAELNKVNSAPHEQDSVEVFIDEGNHKSAYFQDDDGQYRVNFANERSFYPPSLSEGFVSRTVISGNSYTVAIKIPFRTIKPNADTVIGFDLQINGASTLGLRQSIAVWNDVTGNAWQEPSCFGLLRLVKQKR